MRQLVLITIVLVCVTATAQDKPKVEVFGGYSYFHTHQEQPTSGPSTGVNFNGGSGSIAAYFNDWLGAEGDIGVYHHGASGGGCGECSISSTAVSYLFGPKIAARKNATLTPFAHALFGGMHQSNGIGGNTASANAFAMAIGGGLDAKMSKRVAIRAFQVEYVLTTFTDGLNNRQNGVRLSVGIVFRFD